MESTETTDGRDGSPEDGTLGGYLSVHERPPSFQGSDGHPYTVSIEVEKVGDLTAPFGAYLVFPRWAAGGIGIVGHVQTPLLSKGRSREAAERGVAQLSLLEVKELLDRAIDRRRMDGVEW